MKLKEENQILRDLVLYLNAYIPHRCYNCKHRGWDTTYCSLHDRPIIGKEDSCGRFEMEIYDKARAIGIEL